MRAGFEMVRKDILKIGKDRESVYFLGYKMRLTPIEYKILASIDANERIGTASLMAELDMHELQKGNVAVHICAINRKVKVIGGRRLILFSGGEYYFNEDV